MTTPTKAMHTLCETCGSPLNHQSECSTPGCGQPGVPYEVWQRTIIDTLWAEKWELSHVKPAPPLQKWYEAGRDPAECAARILTHHKLISKKPKKAKAGTRRAPAGTKKPKSKSQNTPTYPRLANLPKD